jgi:preprotein translocase subunit SecG
MVETVIWIMHMLGAVSMVGLILLQHGKGADVGAAFGSGSAGSLFGSTGAANFLSRTTAVLAGVFFATSLGLTYFQSHTTRQTSVMQSLKPDIKSAAPVEKKPAVPGPAAPTGDSKQKDVPK